MMAIVGGIFILACVVGAFILEGGHLPALIQPLELLIIGGSALGTLIICASPYMFKEMIRRVLQILKGSGITKAAYIELLQCMFELIKMASANPISIEPHVENPEGSEIFKRYPAVLHNHHAIEFICDTLKVQIASSLSPYDLEDLMNSDLDVAHDADHHLVATMNRTGDAFPGLGIVAAVLGVVITMGKLTQGKEVIGHSVGAALVGTLLGILIAYGYIQPMVAKIETIMGEEAKFVNTAKICLLAYAKGVNAKVCAEFGRRSIPLEFRPNFKEVDEATANAGKK
ncbi:MAG: flagellar motor stator protein MotA [Bacteriovorax sp.]|nr:flagellar motor stator protein MotA [Bacteriovorax sp.]